MNVWVFAGLLLFTALIVDIQATSGHCPPGYKDTGGNKCYKVVESPPIKWSEALAACRIEPGILSDLAAINSQAEQDVIESLGVHQKWIGLTRQNSYYPFAWSDGSDVSYTNWLNNYRSPYDDCVLNNYPALGGNRWVNFYCELTNGYICQTLKAFPNATTTSAPTTTTPVSHSTTTTVSTTTSTATPTSTITTPMPPSTTTPVSTTTSTAPLTSITKPPMPPSTTTTVSTTSTMPPSTTTPVSTTTSTMPPSTTSWITTTGGLTNGQVAVLILGLLVAVWMTSLVIVLVCRYYDNVALKQRLHRFRHLFVPGDKQYQWQEIKA